MNKGNDVASCRLAPAEGIEQVDGETFARSTMPWFKLVGLLPGGWLRLRYRSSFFDEPVRPLLRSTLADGKTSIQTMNGAVLGAAEWIGHVPNGTTSLSISPAARLGRLDFAIDSVETVSRAALLARAAIREPAWTMVSVGGRLISARQEARQALKFAISSCPFEAYDQWYRALTRPFNPNGLDRPRSDWRLGAMFRLITSLEGTGGDALTRTLQSLRSQAYIRWTLHAFAGPNTRSDIVAAYCHQMLDDRRLALIDLQAIDRWASTGDRIAIVGIGDTLPDYALAVLAETIARDPDAAIVYGDEDAEAPNGELHSPVFKPNWSPTFQEGSPYLGRLTCFNYGDLVRAECVNPERLVADESATVSKVTALSPLRKVIHISRILYRRMREKGHAPAPPPVPSAAQATNEQWPEVTVVIPTRDHAGYLKPCIDGLKSATDYPNFKVVVVDNGSVEGDAVAFLGALEKDSRFIIIRHPGSFNYSAMCNLGVAATDAAVVVLLNNDIAMIDPGWLRPLVRWAIRTDVGAVGAKLVYPNGRIQHAGVVVGSGGRAGHIYKGSSATDSGYLHQLDVAREVAAVTGACMAVERSKFDAVGGLDAKNLPVELSDVDLCLRLAELGWRTVWTPQAVLCHVESGSRHWSLHPGTLYGKEREYFVDRWAHVIRDDPYFHPGLSLYAHYPALALD